MREGISIWKKTTFFSGFFFVFFLFYNTENFSGFFFFFFFSFCQFWPQDRSLTSLWGRDSVSVSEQKSVITKKKFLPNSKKFDQKRKEKLFQTKSKNQKKKIQGMLKNLTNLEKKEKAWRLVIFEEKKSLKIFVFWIFFRFILFLDYFREWIQEFFFSKGIFGEIYLKEIRCQKIAPQGGVKVADTKPCGSQKKLGFLFWSKKKFCQPRNFWPSGKKKKWQWSKKKRKKVQQEKKKRQSIFNQKKNPPTQKFAASTQKK